MFGPGTKACLLEGASPSQSKICRYIIEVGVELEGSLLL